MNLQAMIDAMNESESKARSGYHLTLGELSEALNDADQDALVLFDDGRCPGSIYSYRGYYIDLAIDECDKPKMVKEWRGIATDALTSTFVGYKGGDYPASPEKPLWRSEYGEASGVGVMASHTDIEKRFILVTKQID